MASIDAFRKKVAPPGTEWTGNYLVLAGETENEFITRKRDDLPGQGWVIIDEVVNARFPDIQNSIDLARATYPHCQPGTRIVAVYGNSA